MLPHPRFKMSTRGAEWAVAPGGTEALPELGTTHTFACNNPCRLDTDELLRVSERGCGHLFIFPRFSLHSAIRAVRSVDTWPEWLGLVCRTRRTSGRTQQRRHQTGKAPLRRD